MGKGKFFGIIILSALLAIAGCKAKDTVPPTISVKSPDQGDIISTGTTVPVVLDLKDNDDLLQYTVVLKATEDPLAGNVLPAFSYGDASAVFGKELIDTLSIVIPAKHAVGSYLLEASATDLAGNESDITQVTLHMKNGLDDKAPQFSISTLSETQANTYGPQADIAIDGSAQDNRELGGMRVEIKDLDNNLVAIREFQFQSQSTNFTNTIKAPAQNGTYNLIITVADNVNNQTEKVYTLKVQ